MIFIFIGGACDGNGDSDGNNIEKNRTTTDESDDNGDSGNTTDESDDNGDNGNTTDESDDNGDNGNTTDESGEKQVKVALCKSKIALTLGAVETTPTTVGYGNTSFKYFYYHKDDKIYYSSRNSIYKMDLDGSNIEELKVNDAGTYTVNQYVYVYNDVVYYNNAEDKKIYAMNTDGTNHAEFVDGSGEMRVYGNRFFYFVEKEKKSLWGRINYDLMSIQSGSTTCRIEVPDVNALHKDTGAVRVSGGNFHVKDNTIYFHSGSNELYSTPLGSGGTSKTTVSQGKYDNYVFTDDVIYFRWHRQSYSIGRGAYHILDSKPVLVKKNDEEIYEEASLNASSGFFVYVNRIPWEELNKEDSKKQEICASYHPMA